MQWHFRTDFGQNPWPTTLSSETRITVKYPNNTCTHKSTKKEKFTEMFQVVAVKMTIYIIHEIVLSCQSYININKTSSSRIVISINTFT